MSKERKKSRVGSPSLVEVTWPAAGFPPRAESAAKHEVQCLPGVTSAFCSEGTAQGTPVCTASWIKAAKQSGRGCVRKDNVPQWESIV